MKFLKCLVLILLSSCGSNEVKQNLDTSYRSSGVEQFFLPELPAWANYSAPGQCFKVSSFRYMDFSKLSPAYSLNYVQMVEMQAQFNNRLEDYFKSTTQKFVKPVEESAFFANTLEQVREGVKLFKLPNVNEVEIVWLEGFLKDGKLADLKKLAQSGRFDEKLPVLFSSCHSKQSLAQWVTEHDLDDAGFYFITAEWLSPYSKTNVLRPGPSLDLAEFFGPQVKYSHYFPLNVPPELL